MNTKQLDEQVSVSEQFGCGEMAQLATAGIEVVVCNRTEGEAEDQPSFAELEQAAKDAGMEFVAIPFARGQMTPVHCEQFAEVLATGKKVHAFCRTGNRSCNVWAAAKCLVGADKKSLVNNAREAGFDVSGVVVAIEARS